MKTTFKSYYLIFILLSIVFSGYTFLYTTDNDFIKELKDKLSVFNDKTSEDRVYLHLDKPLYKPGETIWFAAYLRNASDLKKSDKSDILYIELVNPKGNIEKSYKLRAKYGVAKGDILLEDHLPGGIYKVRAYTNWQKNDQNALLFEKEIQLQKIVYPNLLMKLEFKEKGFGPGDEVCADLSIRTLEDKPLAKHDFDYTISLAGTRYEEYKGITDPEGKAMIRFTLPKNLKTNDGLLNIIIDFDNNKESISRSIPILLNTLQFELYPEGGDLVSGLKSRIAFQALDEFGKPADVEGIITDKNNSTIASFKSFHSGMGAFSFTPNNKTAYKVKITKPKGITQEFDFPDILNRGFILNASPDKGKVDLIIRSSFEEEVSIIGQIRGKIYYSDSFNAKIGDNRTTVNTTDLPAGVMQFTLFDKKGIERAERLVFVNNNKQLNIEISTDKEEYMPREKVKMTIQAFDERYLPMPAQLSVAVVDDKLVSLKNDKSGNILSKLLLEPDITGEVNEPSFYFDPEEEKANKALDYLLMTRGWRRFVWNEILSGRNPEINHRAERAVISGIVTQNRSNKPLNDVRIVITKKNVSTYTDKNGRFFFSNLDVTFPAEIKCIYKGDIFYRTLWDYEEDVNIKIPGAVQNHYMTGYGSGTLKGTIRDAETGEAIPMANVTVEINGNIITGAMTDFDGNYTIKPVPAGRFNIKASYIGYHSVQQAGVFVSSGKITFINFHLNSALTELNEVEVIDYKVPLIEKDNTETGGTIRNNYFNRNSNRSVYRAPKSSDSDINKTGTLITTEEIEKIAGREVNNIVTTIAGVYSEDGEIGSIRGGRGEGNIIYIDGVKVRGTYRLPNTAIEEISIKTGGISARYENDGSMPEKSNISSLSIWNSPPERKKMRQLSTSNNTEFQSTNYYRSREFPKIVYKSDKPVEKRNDFRTTIFWAGDIELDKKGKAEIEFYNSDAVTTFRATVEGIAADGAPGRAEKTYFTQLPFSLTTKLPIVSVNGDKIIVPLTLRNNTESSINGKLNYRIPKGWNTTDPLPDKYTIGASDVTTLFLGFDVINLTGKDTFFVSFSGKGMEEGFTRNIEVVPQGFPCEYSFSGQQKEAEFEVNIKEPVGGSVSTRFVAYPTLVSNLAEGIESMLREPYGCFEQLSSTTYPNIMILQYLEEHECKNQKIKKQALNYLENGYRKLAAYESKTGGFDWYGKDPGNESLTAFGLMEFIDMKTVLPYINIKMIERTKEWLLSRKDGNGGFKNSRGKWGYGLADDDVTNAYIVWALCEAGISGIDKELDHCYRKATDNNDPYQAGLVANSFFLMSNYKKGNELLDILTGKQNTDGSWDGKIHSITRSTGKSLKVETTSIIILAFLKSREPDMKVVNKAIEYIRSCRSAYGGFGSSQATVLALKAINEYSKYTKRIRESGAIAIYVDGKQVMKKNYEKDVEGAIIVEGWEKELPEGKHKIRIQYIDAKYPMPYSMGIKWNTFIPESDEKSDIRITTQLSSEEIRIGETVRMTINLNNITGKELPSPIAIIGIPAGLSLQPWQLKELSEKEIFDYYETGDNNIVLYFRYMKPNETKTINFDLKSEIPGEYQGQASYAYLYYTSEYKSWENGARIMIRP